MVFSSLLFLFYFLVPVLIIYRLVPTKAKNLTLFVFSLIFYAWGEPTYIFLMLFSAVFNYYSGFIIEKGRQNGNGKTALTVNIIVNIGLLVLFKYADFFISTVNGVIRTNFPLLKLALPIGISFYTFQALSYCIDVYRGKTEVQKSFISFGLYLALFPQLIAGPIVRYDDIALQLSNHPQKISMFSEGLQRFCAGLAKKVLIANNVGQLWELCAATDGRSMLCAWLGILAYTAQIYYDFSGYSDMAIGLGKMFGFSFCENFKYPYISKSITEFWRRWHISLSTWFKEYVYIPLGGSRIYDSDYPEVTKIGKFTLSAKTRAGIRRYCNIFVVWMLTGLWHGASFNFLAWGIYYGILLIVEKKYLLSGLEKKPKALRSAYTMFIVMIGWVLFAGPDFKTAFSYIGSMFNVLNFGFTDSLFYYRLTSNWLVLAASVIGFSPRARIVFAKITSGKLHWLRPLLSFVAVVVCLTYLVDDTYNPFLYFRF